MATITGSEVLARALKAQGTDAFFYIMGGPMIETESELLRLGVRGIDTRHEQAAAMEAHAWTRLSRRPGVCMGASGPGTTNLLTGVANAWADASPLVAVGGSSPLVQFGMEAFQEMDQVAVFRPVTKWAERVHDVKRIPDMVDMAFRQATAGRPGPVYLDMPGDVLGAKIEDANLTYPGPWKPSPRRSEIPRPSARPSRSWPAPSGRSSSRAAGCSGRTGRRPCRRSSTRPACRSTPRPSRAA